MLLYTENLIDREKKINIADLILRSSVLGERKKRKNKAEGITRGKLISITSCFWHVAREL